MHPTYLVDYIDKCRVEITNDIALLEEAVKDYTKTMPNLLGKDIEWYLTHVMASGSIYKHHLFQLQKRLEKETDASKQI